MNLRDRRRQQAEAEAVVIAQRLHDTPDHLGRRPAHYCARSWLLHTLQPSRVQAHAIHLLQRAGVVSAAHNMSPMHWSDERREKCYSINQEKLAAYLKAAQRSDR